MAFGTVELLVVALCMLLTYFALRFWKDPLRKIPGPRGIPLLGNALSISLQSMHTQFYELARKYGPVTKISLFGSPFVILSSTEACLEALVKRGTDFQGRPPLPRNDIITQKDVTTLSIEDPVYKKLRRLFVKAMKAYGPGTAHLESIMQETTLNIVDAVQEKNGEPLDTHELSNGYVCCGLASMLFGEKYSYNDEVCQQMHTLNKELFKAVEPISIAAILDLFPILFNFKFLFRSTHRQIKHALNIIDEFTYQRIREAKKSFDKNQKRGCLDYFIETQQEELDEEGKPTIDDVEIRGLLIDFMVGGMETTINSMSQAFLDLLHDIPLQRKIQEQIDSQFEPTHTITPGDKKSLPLLEAYIYENVRYLSTSAFLLPHMTIRDTEVAGYEIPANTRVLMNNFRISHNPDVYDEPFKVKPERFLDKDGNLVDAGHPARANFLGFGSGRRQCPGEALARSRIFLFLANILQKFNIEPVGELPDRDVRNYEIGISICPPPVSARFIRRQ